jgi:putative copper export protein
MLNWALHFHLIAAIGWIGGSLFMFVLGITLVDKKKQQEVYPNIGPIFGYFELGSLAVLLITGIFMIVHIGIFYELFSNDTSKIIELLHKKLWLVLFILIATIIHFYIALKTNGKERTPLQNFLSRSSSMIIFFLNLFILHYAILIRSILG